MNELTFNENQVLCLLRQVEAGASVVQVCRKYGIRGVGQYSVPRGPAIMAMRNGLFSRPDHALGNRNAFDKQSPPPDPATDAGFPRFVRRNRASTRLFGVPRFLVVDNSPKFEGLINELMYSFGIRMRREISSVVTLHRDDCIRECTGLSSGPARRVRRRHYSDDFKMMAVALANSVGRKKAARQLGIPTKTLGNWLDASLADSPQSSLRSNTWQRQ